MQFGSSVDDGLFVLAACLVATFSCALPAFVVAASVPCDPALFLKQWLYPGCFQTWNFDGVFIYFQLCSVRGTFLGVMILSGFSCLVALRGLMARATRAGAALCLFIVGFFWSYQSFAGGAAAVAFSYFFKKKKMQAAAACAPAIEGVHVSEFLLTSCIVFGLLLVWCSLRVDVSLGFLIRSLVLGVVVGL